MKIIEKIHGEIKSLVFKDVSNDTSLIKSGLLDSISVVDLVIFIEEETGLKIPENHIIEENFDSIDNIKSYLSKRTED
tara:strand:- start:114 stop:347 length:234 start_codon:yes stop_codon:yes gene_type:complete